MFYLQPRWLLPFMEWNRGSVNRGRYKGDNRFSLPSFFQGLTGCNSLLRRLGVLSLTSGVLAAFTTIAAVTTVMVGSVGVSLYFTSILHLIGISLHVILLRPGACVRLHNSRQFAARLSRQGCADRNQYFKSPNDYESPVNYCGSPEQYQ
jgi:hypothetical protein